MQTGETAMSASSSRDQFAAGARQTRARSSRVRNWVSLVASLAVVAAGFASFGSVTASAATTTTVVGNGDIAPNGPWALEPTSTTGTYSFVNGPSGPHPGVGSLAMSIASGQHEWLDNYAYGYCQTGNSCSTYA